MEWVSGNLYIRPMYLREAGAVVQGHTHNFDHTTIVFTGAVRVVATLPDGRTVTQDFHAPAHMLIKKDVTHEITALEDHTQVWCVYAHRTPQGDVVQEVTGWMDAYL